MIGLGEFFKRIQNVHSKRMFRLLEIQKAINKHVGVEVPLQEISVNNSVVTLKNISSSLRSAIFIKKTAILGDLKLKDIR